MKKSGRVAMVHNRAFRYARSGEYRNWYAIELQLRKEGFPEARSELDDRALRAELNEICRKHHAQSRGGASLAPAGARRMGLHGRDDVAAGFSWDVIADRLAEVYGRVAKPG